LFISKVSEGEFLEAQGRYFKRGGKAVERMPPEDVVEDLHLYDPEEAKLYSCQTDFRSGGKLELMTSDLEENWN